MIRRALLIVLVPLALVLGLWLGGHPDALPQPVRDVFVDDSETALFDEAMDIIEANYFRPVSRAELVDRSLNGAVTSLKDQFSAYFDPKSYKQFQEATSGAFEGVGMTVQEVDKGLEIVRVFDGSPAKDAGLRSGDVIIAVDGKSIAGKPSQQATAQIKGPAGTRVKLTWLRGKERVTKQVERARVDIPVVDSEMKRSSGERVGWVSLAQFTSGAHGEVGAAVKELLADGAQSVVLDLRGNGGGLLNEAVLVSSVFIDDGVIVSTKGRSRPERQFKAVGNAIDESVPVVVLVDGGSASASEIVTGAIQDRNRGTVVGTKTFGKGVFQEVRQLSNGGALDITVGEYFTPSGRNLGGGGVKRGAGIRPDVRAEDDVKTTKRDEALDVALRIAARGASAR